LVVCVCLPKSDGKIDEELATKMLNYAYDNGVNYFDNAYMYLDFQDEKFVGNWLSTKPRDSFYVTSKMPVMMIKSLDDAKRIFEEQLSNLKVAYFDFYLIHALKQEYLGFYLREWYL
jgi:predicted aldo/keto reductase-like oxidoreductase